ncbi:MAG: PAS domain S-box protein, partial [Gammaproteobacteria bacterium]|nr:PAS domain S-box protein [Gammaproteobacteria bacterium]
NSLPGLFYVFDERRFVRWNREWNRITGYGDEELGGRYGTDFFEGEDKLLIGERMLKVFREGVSGAEAELVTKDGRRIPYYFTGLRKKIDGREHIVGLGIDVTERKQAKEALQDTLDALEIRVNERTAELAKTNDALRNSVGRFRSLVESTSDWIWELDNEANFTYASPQVKEILGYDPEELVGKMTRFDLMPPVEAEAIRAKYSSFIAAAEPFDAMTNVNLHRDGQEVVMESSGRPFFDAEGELLGYRGIDRDISERRKLLEALKNSEERHRSLIEATTSIIWTTDASGGFVELQPSWEKFTGQPWSDHKGFGWTKKIHPDDIEHVLEAWKKACRELSFYETWGKIWNDSLKEWRDFEVSAVPLMKTVGTLREWVGGITDVTERKQMGKALLNAKEAAENANRIKSEFLANMSHEIRTPLNAVTGISYLLSQTRLTNKQAEYIDTIHRSMTHVTGIIDDLLDFSKAEAGKLELETIPFDLDQVLDTLADFVI